MSPAAVALANAYYQISRSEGDPRYLGYAQAALAPWWKDPEAPTAVLVSRATILQSNHEFDRALADLDRAIAREPKNGRALLVRSTVLTVQGKYAEARADCPKLYRTRARVLCLRLHGRDRQPHRQGCGCGGDARTRAGIGAGNGRRRARVGRVAAGRNRAAPRRPDRGAAFPGGARGGPARSLHAGRVQRLAARQSTRGGRDPARPERDARRRAAAAPGARAKGAATAGGRREHRYAARALRRQPRARRRRAPARGVALPVAVERRCAGRAAARP